jgi:hypothetical protein
VIPTVIPVHWMIASRAQPRMQSHEARAHSARSALLSRRALNVCPKCFSYKTESSIKTESSMGPPVRIALRYISSHHFTRSWGLFSARVGLSCALRPRSATILKGWTIWPKQLHAVPTNRDMVTAVAVAPEHVRKRLQDRPVQDHLPNIPMPCDSAAMFLAQ